VQDVDVLADLAGLRVPEPHQVTDSQLRRPRASRGRLHLAGAETSQSPGEYSPEPAASSVVASSAAVGRRGLVAVPRADAAAVLAELRRVHEGWDTAYIAAHVPVGTDPGPWSAALESSAGEVAGRPRWGKLHGLDATDLRVRYPRFDGFLTVRDRLDPGGVLSNAYLERVLGPVH
jgi:hypothetical protein